MHDETPSSEPGNPCTLSIHRAFVVRLYDDLDLAHARVEHVVSGEGSEFHSADELLRFMGRPLRWSAPILASGLAGTSGMPPTPALRSAGTSRATLSAAPCNG
jgi:hypothetical protein